MLYALKPHPFNEYTSASLTACPTGSQMMLILLQTAPDALQLLMQYLQ